MQWPRFMRRPLNLISVPTIVEVLPLSKPGFAFGDPRQDVASLEINYGKGLLPFNAQSKSFIAPFPCQGEDAQLLLERLDDLPSKMMVALYESKTPLWPNFLIHHSGGDGLNLQGVRSCMRHKGQGFSEAWCVLPAKKMARLLRAQKVSKSLFLAPAWENKRFLGTALDYQRTLSLLENTQPLVDAERITVVMPHYDDEVLQCGGTMLRALAANATLQVIWLSDGSRGVSSVSHQKSSEIRRAEAEAAMAELGVKNMHHLDGVETKLAADDTICQQLNHLLSEFRPQRVHSVWWADNHVDHYEANLILERAWPHDLDATIAASGLWQVMPLRTVVELTDEQQAQKIKSLECYQSQIDAVDYARLSQHLDAYYAHQSDANYAENFWHVSAQQYFSALQNTQVKTRRWFG